MKRLGHFVFLSIVFFSSVGCSHYIEQLHRNIDRRLDAKAKKGNKKDKEKNALSIYKKNEAKNPRISTLSHRYVYPSVKRNYVPVSKKRYKAEDLRDIQSDGSLWKDKKNNQSFFFAEDNFKSKGDIVLIEVRRNLKNIITAELKRAYPNRNGKISPTGKNPASLPNNTEAQANANTTAQDDDQNDNKIYDRISSMVIEEVSRNHLLLKGRKSLIYQSQKRLVEIQSLVAKRDIDKNNAIDSDRIIESNVVVIR